MHCIRVCSHYQKSEYRSIVRRLEVSSGHQYSALRTMQSLTGMLWYLKDNLTVFFLWTETESKQRGGDGAS